MEDGEKLAVGGVAGRGDCRGRIEGKVKELVFEGFEILMEIWIVTRGCKMEGLQGKILIFDGKTETLIIFHRE